jgi:hypothetical protein
MQPSIRTYLRNADDRLWRMIFGRADYMMLHPPFKKRLRIALGLPLSFAMESCEEPIFLVGCPRSGTTLLFHILSLSSSLHSFGQESHWVWELLHPPSGRADYSQVLRAEDLTRASRFFIRGCYVAAFGKRRFVDKCPTNSLRISAVKKVFPGAKIVCITRNGFDNISSLIDTWQHRRQFLGFDVPEALHIEGYGRQKWVHILTPGWQQYAESALEEVCAHQWVKTNEILLETKDTVPPEDWIDVRYETLFLSPEETVRNLYASLGLNLEPAVIDFALALDKHVLNTDSKPEIGKWKVRNRERLSKVAGDIEPMMSRLGYRMEDYL